jgi:hypothetical protein
MAERESSNKPSIADRAGGRAQPPAASAAAKPALTLTDEERERIRHEAHLRAEIRRELEAATAKPVKRPRLLSRIVAKVGPTTLIALFMTLITLIVGYYHDYATKKDHATKQAADIQKANRDKRMTLLSAFPNEIETSHGILTALVKKRIWLASHRADTDQDELGRPRKQVDQEFWEVWKMYSDARKPYAILTEVKVFFDSTDVIVAVDRANAAITKEYTARTEDELDADVGEAQTLLEKLTEAMSDELNETMVRPKHARGAAREAPSRGSGGVSQESRPVAKGADSAGAP